MLVDLDYFFAQCEEMRNPSLKDKPLVVCVYSGRTADSGAVSTANYVARKYGVRSGMPIYMAKKKLENVLDAMFLPVDHDFYESVSERIMTILRGYADSFEQVGIDEAYLDVTNKTSTDFEAARSLAEDMKREIRLREGLTCSIGIGPNKLVAKMAADVQKPDGLTVVKPEDVKDFLAPLPVNSLLGVGRKTAEKMESLGIGTVQDLAKYDVQKLVRVFGKTLGTYFHEASLGVDNQPVQEKGEAESISRIATLKEDTRELKMMAEKTDELCRDVQATVVERKLLFRTVSVIAVMSDLSIHTRTKTLENPTDQLDTLKVAVDELAEKLISESEMPARRVGVKVSGFSRKSEEQKQITSFFGQKTD